MSDGNGFAGGKGLTLVMGNWRYGVGHELAEAKKNFTGQGGRLSDGYTIVRFDADTEYHGVDQMGRIHYVGNPFTTEDVQHRKVARR